MPHRALIGNLPGFVASHNWFPQPGDVFWSPADWAWTGGLMDALLPTMYFGFPIVGFRGRFGAERAFELMQRHGVTNAFLFPTALKMMMKSVPEPRATYRLKLRSLMSAGEAVGQTVFDWCRDALGVTVNEMFGQTEMNYIVGNSHQKWPARAGSMGRPYPGHRVAVIDDNANVMPAGETGEVAIHRRDIHGDLDPIFFLEYWRNAERDTQQVQRRLVPHRRSRQRRPRWLPLVPGPRRRHVQGGGLPHRTERDRELPGQASGGGQCSRSAEARYGARRAGQGIRGARRRLRRIIRR